MQELTIKEHEKLKSFFHETTQNPLNKELWQQKKDFIKELEKKYNLEGVRHYIAEGKRNIIFPL